MKLSEKYFNNLNTVNGIAVKITDVKIYAQMVALEANIELIEGGFATNKYKNNADGRSPAHLTIHWLKQELRQLYTNFNMTPAQIEQSKILAEFMGLEFTEFKNLGPRYLVNQYWTPIPNLKYHTSYDWLMPVWVKFRDLKFDNIERTEMYYRHIAHRNTIVDAITFGTIEESFTALANALKWYNEIK